MASVFNPTTQEASRSSCSKRTCSRIARAVKQRNKTKTNKPKKRKKKTMKRGKSGIQDQGQLLNKVMNLGLETLFNLDREGVPLQRESSILQVQRAIQTW